MIARLRLPIVVGVVALVALACQKQEPPDAAFTGDISRGNPTTTAAEAADITGEAPEAEPAGPELTAQVRAELADIPEGCSILSSASCLLPFPSDEYTRADSSTGTGRRVALPSGQLPNTSGQTLDVSEWNRNDGFSPNTPILIHVPDIDPALTNLPPEGDIGMSVTEASSTVLVDLDTGQLVPHWAEMDRRADSATDRALIIRPATSLLETHRFAVALRDVIGTAGTPLEAPPVFRVLRDNKTIDAPRVSDLQKDYDIVFAEMADAGVERSDLYLAWWFTVASEDSLSSRLLEMRDDAFGRLNGGSPDYRITSTSTDDLEDGIAKVVDGTFEVPLYLDDGGRPGSRMVYSPQSGDPMAVGTYTAQFECVVPDQALDTGEARPVVYGHGLLGSADEVSAGNVQRTAAELNAVYCATNWIGLSEQDVANAVEVLGDLSQFPTVADRLQQGILNTLFLGRLMLHEDGLGADPAFETTGGANLLNTETAYFDGNSQGAIMGGAATAVAQDWTKAVLGVGGMNYSTLLNRSVDFDEYFAVMRQAYPDPLEQQILFGIIQMLWDRGETGGYVQHLLDRTYDLTPPKTVLMTVAFGDHQVATVTADNMARALNIPIYQPALPEGASPQKSPNWNLDPIRAFPLSGSALYYWYAGTLAPPEGNITPTMGAAYEEACTGANAAKAETDPQCMDPHGDPRRQPKVIEQKDAFFQPDGVITNVCHDKVCEVTPRDELEN